MACILVIDDEPLLRDEAVETLSRDGHDVFHAADGNEAMKYIRTRPIEIIITDILMPQMNGFDVINEVRRDFGQRNDIKIIAMSNGGIMADPKAILDKSEEFGADYLLPKPFSLDALRTAIADVLEVGPPHEAEYGLAAEA
jgi:CheY-like chemotaxis protein